MTHKTRKFYTQFQIFTLPFRVKNLCHVNVLGYTEKLILMIIKIEVSTNVLSDRSLAGVECLPPTKTVATKITNTVSIGIGHILQ